MLEPTNEGAWQGPSRRNFHDLPSSVASPSVPTYTASNVEEGDEEIDGILGGIFSDDDPMTSVSPSQVVDDESTKSGVGTASTLVAVYVGTDGLATDEGRSWELHREGACQAPSLVGSNVEIRQGLKVDLALSKWLCIGDLSFSKSWLWFCSVLAGVVDREALGLPGNVLRAMATRVLAYLLYVFCVCRTKTLS